MLEASPRRGNGDDQTDVPVKFCRAPCELTKITRILPKNYDLPAGAKPHGRFRTWNAFCGAKLQTDRTAIKLPHPKMKGQDSRS